MTLFQESTLAAGLTLCSAVDIAHADTEIMAAVNNGDMVRILKSSWFSQKQLLRGLTFGADR